MKRIVFAVVLAMFAPVAFAGTTYRFETTMTGAAHRTIAGAVETENGRTRTTFTSGDGVLFSNNSFALTNDGRSMTVFDPSAKTYYELSADQLTSGTSGMLDQLRQMFQLTITNPKVTSRTIAGSETIEGYPTKHVAVDASYDISIDAMGQKMTMATSSTIENWMTDKLPFSATSIMQMRGFHLGVPELDDLLEKQIGSITGFPLKQVVTTHVVQNGNSVDMTQTTTISGIETKAIPASEFVAPAGYTKVDNPIEKIMGALKKR